MPSSVPIKEATPAPQRREPGLLSRVTQILRPSQQRTTPSLHLPAVGATFRSVMHGHGEPVGEKAERMLLRQQLERNEQIEEEEQRALTHLPAIQARILQQESQAKLITQLTGPSSGTGPGLAEKYRVPPVPVRQVPSGGVPLQRIDSFDIPPASPVIGANLSRSGPVSTSHAVGANDPMSPTSHPQVDHVTPQVTTSATPAATAATASASPGPVPGSTLAASGDPPPMSPAATPLPVGANVAPMRDAPSQPVEGVPGASMDPMLRYLDEMSTAGQSSMLLNPSNFREGYHAGPHVPTADRMLGISDIAQIFDVGQAHQMQREAPGQVGPGAARMVSTAAGESPILNPITVLQAPPIGASIVTPGVPAPVPPAVQVLPDPGQVAALQDPRFPPGILKSVSFPEESSPATGLETTSSNGQQVQYF